MENYLKDFEVPDEITDEVTKVLKNNEAYVAKHKNVVKVLVATDDDVTTDAIANALNSYEDILVIGGLVLEKDNNKVSDEFKKLAESEKALIVYSSCDLGDHDSSAFKFNLNKGARIKMFNEEIKGKGIKAPDGSDVTLDDFIYSSVYTDIVSDPRTYNTIKMLGKVIDGGVLLKDLLGDLK